MGKLTFWVVSIPMFLFGIGNNVTVHFSVHDDGGNAVTNAEIKARTRRDRLEWNVPRRNPTGFKFLLPPCFSFQRHAPRAARVHCARGLAWGLCTGGSQLVATVWDVDAMNCVPPVCAGTFPIGRVALLRDRKAAMCSYVPCRGVSGHEQVVEGEFVLKVVPVLVVLDPGERDHDEPVAAAQGNRGLERGLAGEKPFVFRLVDFVGRFGVFDFADVDRLVRAVQQQVDFSSLNLSTVYYKSELLTRICH